MVYMWGILTKLLYMPCNIIYLWYTCGVYLLNYFTYLKREEENKINNNGNNKVYILIQ